MRVLFLMFAFPDMDVSFNMYTALVEEFIKNGHDVSVVAPVNQQRKTEISIEKGISILRVKTLPIKNVGNIRKGIANLLLPYQYDRAINKHFKNKKFDLVVMPTPPITLVKLAAKIKYQNNALFYLVLRDIFPQNAVDLGFMRKGGFIHRYFRKKERNLYNEADVIGCMSDGNIRYILDHNKSIPENKLEVLRNFQKKYDYSQNSNQIGKEVYGLEGKFVVVFGGNMGKAQQLENVIELAKKCSVYPNVLFLLLGEGTAMQRLETSITERNIINIKILGTIPKQEYQDLLGICDIGLISLHQNFSIPNIPSKTLDYFNVGLPVLASVDKATDYGSVLDEANAGLWSYAKDIEAFKHNFDKLYLNPELRKEMGKNGRKYFEQFLTPDIAYQKIISHLQ